MSWKETITKLDFTGSDPVAYRCACCGGSPGLYEVDREGTVTKMVNCETASLRAATGEEEDDMLGSACPLYSTPGMVFNKATRREAINYWNEFNAMLAKLREKNEEKRCG